MSAYMRGVAWAEQTLTPLAERIVAAIEDAPEAPLKPTLATHDLESELLEGGGTPTTVQRMSMTDGSEESIAATEARQLRSDCESLLHQRERLRAQLIAEQERRERAESELVAVGAQWLGTDTQEALRKRAESDKQRELDAARVSIQREADQRVARCELERAVLLKKLGKYAPNGIQLQLLVRAALKQELERERQEVRDSVHEQLRAAIDERDRLMAELRATESRHRSEMELLRESVRKASELLQEEYDKGFVCGLKQAASALAMDPMPEATRQTSEGAPTAAEGFAATTTTDQLSSPIPETSARSSMQSEPLPSTTTGIACEENVSTHLQDAEHSIRGEL